MYVRQLQRYCYFCRTRTLHKKSAFRFVTGVVLSLISLGLFLPIWLINNRSNWFSTRCASCGTRRWQF